MRQLELSGYTVEHDPQKVDGEIVVINTCGFIGDAKEESINMILEVAEAKKKGKIKQLYVMGCLSQRYFQELNTEIPEVDKYYGKFDWSQLLNHLGKQYIPQAQKERTLTTPAHYAYLKIAEGCNRSCAYCSIPIITGKYKSRTIEEILDETRYLVQNGVKEIQLIAQDLTYYGYDTYKKFQLPELLQRISDIPKVEWIRLHYAYPAQFPYELLPIMAERENICKYLDIALQHISDKMLKQMRRNITKKQTYDLITRIRSEVPGIHLRTTLMVGHPGEEEEDFQELLQFVKDIRFERMGAFPYSEEEGTYSAKHYKDTIPNETKQQRMNTLMTLQEKIANQQQEEKIGQTLKTIIDREDPQYYIGRSQFDSPEVDPEILIKKNTRLTIGTFYNVQIKKADTFELYGTVHP